MFSHFVAQSLIFPPCLDLNRLHPVSSSLGEALLVHLVISLTRIGVIVVVDE